MSDRPAPRARGKKLAAEFHKTDYANSILADLAGKLTHFHSITLASPLPCPSNTAALNRATFHPAPDVLRCGVAGRHRHERRVGQLGMARGAAGAAIRAAAKRTIGPRSKFDAYAARWRSETAAGLP